MHGNSFLQVTNPIHTCHDIIEQKENLEKYAAKKYDTQTPRKKWLYNQDKHSLKWCALLADVTPTFKVVLTQGISPQLVDPPFYHKHKQGVLLAVHNRPTYVRNNRQRRHPACYH